MHLFTVEKEWSSKNNKFTIVLMGDFHVGSPSCDYDLLEADVKAVSKMDNAIVFLMGDLAEYIVPGDKRWSPEQIDERFWTRMGDLPMAYKDYVRNLLSPIAHMIEVVHDGNHEKGMFPKMYPGSELCALLREDVAKNYGPEYAMNKLRYAPGQAYTKIQWKLRSNSDYRTVMLNTAHGWQASRTPGPKRNEMQHLFEFIGAELIFRGHSHELFCDPGPVQLAPNPTMTKIIGKTTLYGHTGSYLKAYELTERPCYAEDKEYHPLPLGHVLIDVELKGEGLEKSGRVKFN